MFNLQHGVKRDDSLQWVKLSGPLMESTCVENNQNYGKFLGLREYPMPEAKTPDF